MEKLRRAAAWVLALVFGLGAVLSLALTAVQIVTFDVDRFTDAYDRYDRAAFIGIDPEDLKQVTQTMLDYLQNKNDSLLMYAQIQGEEQQVFEERELAHMVDVKGLFMGGFAIRRWSMILAAVSLPGLVLLEKKRCLKYLCRGYLVALAVFAAAGIALGIIMAVDFNAAFIKFHEIFFDNDLWLLDIRTDVLIQMFPEEFFNEMAVAYLTWMLSSLVIPALAAVTGLICIRKKEKA